MSSWMRDWIQPTVCNQLNKAIQDIERDGMNSNLYGEDGTLMTHITTGACIQLIEFISHAAPYSTWVSDSFTQIEAIFSNSSTELLQTLYGRGFSLRSLGAVLGITDYYLTINLKNAPSCRIILKVERFTILGSEGSRAFGYPSRVDSVAVVEKLVSQMCMKWRELNVDQSSPLDQIPSIRSQVGIEADTYSITEDSILETFSTQTPVKVLHQPTTGGHANQNASKRALLDILGPKRTKTAKVRDHEPPASSPSLTGLHLPIELINRGINRAPMPSVTAQHSGIHQGTTVKSIPVELSSSNIDHFRDHVLIPQAISESTLSSSQKVTGVKRNNVNDVFVTQKTSIETTISVRSNADKSPNSIYINSTEPQKPNMPNQPIQDTGHPWEGLTRIPRKYVQIPKDQQNILDDDRAWHSQAHGNRQPDENLPRQVLDGLQAFHDKSRHDEKGGHVDCQSDSSSESSESQEDCRKKSNHLIGSQLAKSLLAQGQDSSRLSTLGHENSMTSLIFISDSSQGNVQSRNGISDTTEMGSKSEEEHGRHTRNPRGGVWKSLPNDQVLLNLELEASDASQEIEDDSTEEEMNSWPSSQNRIESPKSPTSLLPESSRESTAVQTDLLKSPQPQMLSRKISPMPVIDAPSSLPKESQRNSQLSPHSDSENYVEPQSKTANLQFARLSEPSCNGRNVLFSSSPVEMEISVPYALDSQTLRSDGFLVTDDVHAMRHVPFAGQKAHSSLESERVEFGLASPRSPHKKSYDVKVDGMSIQKQQMADISSDPIIPGTYRSEVSNVTRPAELVSTADHAELDHIAFNAGPVVSATPGSPVPPRVHYDPLIGDEKYASGSKNQDDVEGQNLFNFAKSSQLSIPGTQISYCEPLRPSTHVLLADGTIFSTLATPPKRRVYEKRHMAEPSPKRRRTLQAVIFDSVREKDSPIDPTEMAKANRRKFLKDLSLDDDSLFEILQKPQKGPGAQPHTATLAGISLERISTSGGVRALSTDQQEARQSCQGIDLSGRRLEKLVVEEVQEKLVNYARQSTKNASGQASDENAIDSANAQEDQTESLRGETANGHGRISTDNSDSERCEGSLAVSKLQSRSEPESQTETIFETFNTTYPSYGKSLRAFVRACVYLDWLHSMKRAPHPSLWDDFIRAFSAEYASHINKCRLSHQKPMSAHTYYNDHVFMPLFMKRIMNPAKVQEAFLLDPRETAKSCAIISQKKFQKGSESTSTVSSQLSMISEIFTESQEMANLYPASSVSICPQPSNPTTTSCGSPQLEDAVALASNPSRDVTRASDSMLPVKRPFFEIPSQLTTKDFHKVVKLPNFSTLTPNDAIFIDASMENLSEANGVRDMEIAHATGLKQTPQQKLDSEKLPNMFEDTRKRSSTTCQRQTHRRSLLPSAALKREESPILGSETPNPVRIGNDLIQAEPSPSLLANMALCQDSVLRVPNLTALNPVERRTTSTSGLSGFNQEISPISRGTDGFHSIRTTKTQLSGVSKISATFKDFSKAFVPRQRRQSNITTRQPPAAFEHLSLIQTSRMAETDTASSRPPVEPDTQVWRF